MRRLRDHHQLPVVAVHAPCLLITQRVWGSDPWEKLERSAAMPPRCSVPTPWSCTRRFAGSATTPAASSIGHHRARGQHRARVRGGEHVPVAGARPAGAGVRAGVGPGRPRLRARDARPVPLGDRRWRPARDGADAGRPALPRAHDRRLGLGPRRAPGPGARRPALRGVLRAARRARLRRPRRRRGQHPARRRAEPNERPTWPRHWPSPGCTWRRRAGRSERPRQSAPSGNRAGAGAEEDGC